MKILISGGGTGGHLIPGIALYQRFTQEGVQALYVLREDDRTFNASSLIKKEDRLTLSLGRVSRSLSWKTPMQLWNIFCAWRKAFRQIKNFQPDAVLITGGYVSNIAALSAFILRKPLFILEQNSAVGVTNRFWSYYASKIFTFFPQVKNLKANKTIQTGNPLLYDKKISQTEALSFFGLKKGVPVIGISGGSQGAKKLNDMVYQLLPKFSDCQIIWSLGTREYQRFVEEGKWEALQHFPNVKPFRFIERMDCFWGASDGVLARAGAGTVSESLFFQTPTLFVPIYQSPDNHQFLNASYLVQLKSGFLLEEPELNKHNLEQKLRLLLSQQQSLRKAFPKKEQDAAHAIFQHLQAYLQRV